MGLWTIVVDSFPVEQDNRDGRVGPASDLGDGRWQDSGYIEYLANRTEPPYRSPDCCVVEEIEWGPTWEEVMEGNYTDLFSGFVCGEDLPFDQHDDALASWVFNTQCNGPRTRIATFRWRLRVNSTQPGTRKH